MRRSLPVIVVLAVLAGCSRPAPTPSPTPPAPEAKVEPAPAPVQGGLEPAPGEAGAPPIKALPVTAIYHDVAAGYGKKPQAPASPDACRPDAANDLLKGQITALDWKPYPGLSPILWVPAVTVQLCNPGSLLTNGSVEIESLGIPSLEGHERVELPALPSGAGTAMEVYLPVGLPDGIMGLIERKVLPWPELTIQTSFGGRQVLGVPAGETGASTSEWRLPERPSLPLLRAADWTERRMLLSDGTEFFLYAPDMKATLLDLIGCNPPGGLGISGREWSLWSLPLGGAPRQVGSVGETQFQGRFTWSIEERPKVDGTFILLHRPQNCHFPSGAVIWHYDPATEALRQPTITVGEKEYPAGAPTPTIDEYGSLRTYDLTTTGEEGPWIKATYQWNRERLNWSLPSPPSAPGPMGGPTTPETVYPKRP